MVVPTYNERDRLAELVDARCSTRARRTASTLELVIVDDNSPDGTGALADELARTHRISVIHRAGKLGLGTAVVAGFARRVGGRSSASWTPTSAIRRRSCRAMLRGVQRDQRRRASSPAGTCRAAARRTGRSARLLMSRVACLLRAAAVADSRRGVRLLPDPRDRSRRA